MPYTLVFAQGVSATPFTSSWDLGQEHLYLQEQTVGSVMSLGKLSCLGYRLVSCSPSLALHSLYKLLPFKPTTGSHFLMLGQASIVVRLVGWSINPRHSRNHHLVPTSLSKTAYFIVDCQLGTTASPGPLDEFTWQNQLQHEENFPGQLPLQQKKTTQGPQWNQVRWHCTQSLENFKIRQRLLIYIFIHLEVIKSPKLFLQKELCNNYCLMIDAKD